MSRPNRIDVLMEWVATEAFHNSDEPCDAPKCHPRTRTAVLNDIMRWVGESDSARQDFMMWLFGPAGAGKTAIARRIAEMAAEKGVLIATFFFSRTSPTRNTKDRLVPTLAYQLALSNPVTRTHIEYAIEHDPHEISISPELFLSLELGDIQVALINLSSIVSFDESSGKVKILHASLVDFLSYTRRSTIHYIDVADVCTDFSRRFLQYVNGPDGIPDTILFFLVGGSLYKKIPKGRLLNDILDFDLDSFINATIRRQYPEPKIPPIFLYLVLQIFYGWREILDIHFGDGDEKDEALDRYTESFECRTQKYRSDRRLQMLLTLAAVAWMDPSDPKPQIKFSYGHPDCRLVDILLEMDDHDLHLLDQNALDLRHGYMSLYSMHPDLTDIVSDYVDGDEYASAALHCMRFLCDAPKCSYSQRNDSPEMRVIYAEWKSTCGMALVKLGQLLREANSSPELMQFMNNHPAVQKEFFDHHLRLDVNILAFLSRENVCTNWRIISAIRRGLIVKEHPPSKFHEEDAECDEPLDLEMVLNLKRQSLDHCCRNFHLMREDEIKQINNALDNLDR